MKSQSFVQIGVVVLVGWLTPGQAQVLGSANTFAALGGAGVTSAGNTILNGNLGDFPTAALAGFPPGIVNGTIFDLGPIAQQAKIDAAAAFVALGNETAIQDLSGVDLGGLTLDPGVRFFNATAQLTGNLVLDGQGDSNARFDFQIGSTLTTAASANVILIGGARPDNVFWLVGSSATIGAGSMFNGSILAGQSITMNSGASLFGSAVALVGTVTLDNNQITAVPEPATGWLVVAGAAGLGTWQLLGRRRQTVVPHPQIH